jgi:hypothetical protein
LNELSAPLMEFVMKLVLSFAAALIVAAGAATAAVDYTTICNSSKLVAGDRHECRVQMTAAADDAAKQAEIHGIYAAKIESLLYSRAKTTPAAAVLPSDDF